jgi:L-alanine-DL-glutamate epimerase-like enolase superfamily enzyme
MDEAGMKRPKHPHSLTRRDALRAAAGGSLFGGLLALSAEPTYAAKETADSVFGDIRITDVEVHDITPEYDDWIAYQLNHFYGPSKRTVYIVRTNKGIVGLGEGQKEPAGVVQKYIGTSPFDWVGDETSLPLGTAMYDLMGKAAGVPVYKLFGQRYRRWVPVSSWTVSTHPKRMAEAVQKYSAQGHTWMKFHLSPFENVMDQTAAMQAVAPKDFKIHYDLTMGGSEDHMFDFLERLAEFPIAGCFEDPLEPHEIDGYIELRKRLKLPVVLHHDPMNFTYTVLHRAADAYMLGHSHIGTAMRKAGLFEAAEMPFMMQNVGGNMTRAMTTHMQSAFKAASFHFIDSADQWKSDVVNERLAPVNGLVRVPEAPGLGVTINESELERLKKLRLPAHPKWIIKTSFANGTKMFNIANPENSIFMVRPDFSRLFPFRYDMPVTTEYWDNDNSSEYKQMFERIEREGVVLLKS